MFRFRIDSVWFGSWATELWNICDRPTSLGRRCPAYPRRQLRGQLFFTSPGEKEWKNGKSWGEIYKELAFIKGISEKVKGKKARISGVKRKNRKDIYIYLKRMYNCTLYIRIIWKLENEVKEGEMIFRLRVHHSIFF